MSKTIDTTIDSRRTRQLMQEDILKNEKNENMEPMQEDNILKNENMEPMQEQPAVQPPAQPLQVMAVINPREPEEEIMDTRVFYTPEEKARMAERARMEQFIREAQEYNEASIIAKRREERKAFLALQRKNALNKKNSGEESKEELKEESKTNLERTNKRLLKEKALRNNTMNQKEIEEKMTMDTIKRIQEEDQELMRKNYALGVLKMTEGGDSKVTKTFPQQGKDNGVNYVNAADFTIEEEEKCGIGCRMPTFDKENLPDYENIIEENSIMEEVDINDGEMRLGTNDLIEEAMETNEEEMRLEMVEGYLGYFLNNIKGYKDAGEIFLDIDLKLSQFEQLFESMDFQEKIEYIAFNNNIDMVYLKKDIDHFAFSLLERARNELRNVVSPEVIEEAQRVRRVNYEKEHKKELLTKDIDTARNKLKQIISIEDHTARTEKIHLLLELIEENEKLISIYDTKIQNIKEIIDINQSSLSALYEGDWINNIENIAGNIEEIVENLDKLNMKIQKINAKIANVNTETGKFRLCLSNIYLKKESYRDLD